MSELNALRKRNEELETTIRQLQEDRRPTTEGIAGLEETFPVSGTCVQWTGSGHVSNKWMGQISWATAFGLLAPHLMQATNDAKVDKTLAKAIFDALKKQGHSVELDDQVFQTIKVQLMAHRLIALKSYNTIQGGTALFWELTPKGQEQMIAMRTVKKTDSSSS